MTLYKPTLQLVRLRVIQGGHIAYEAKFHTGVNIVRGNNSAGKTTVLDFIAYVLGSENIAWKPQALLCDSVYGEFTLNGAPVTLRRDVNDASQNPLYIFWGTLDVAEKASMAEWAVYPFRRSTQKESFTQVLFRALEMPEVGAGEANLTMHQLLRLLYVDQRSPNNSILRPENFDRVLTRETLERYVFGLYDAALYDAQLRLRDVEGELQAIASELRTLFSVLHRSGQQTDFELILAQVQSLQVEQDKLSAQLRELSDARTPAQSGRDPGVAELRRQLSETKAKLIKAQDRKQDLELEIQDSIAFVGELDRRVRGLDESEAARNYLGTVNFTFCPSCLSTVDLPTEENATNCQLCKAPLGKRDANSQLLRMRNELEIQRQESRRLLQSRQDDFASATREIPVLRAELKGLERDYARQSSTWNTEHEAKIQATAHRLGEVEQQIRQMLEFQKMGAVVAELTAKREALGAELERLRTTIETLTTAEVRRKADARHSVAVELIRLLRADLPRVAEFQNAEHVEWSFADNRISVNGSENFSESSTVILRHSFHLALLFASTKREYFRVPRFLILDGIEDGGLELPRSHHFQRLIVDMSAAIEVEHQIIYATSQIAPELEKPALVVGRAFTTADKSLDVSDPGPGLLPLANPPSR